MSCNSRCYNVYVAVTRWQHSSGWVHFSTRFWNYVPIRDCSNNWNSVQGMFLLLSLILSGDSKDNSFRETKTLQSYRSNLNCVLIQSCWSETDSSVNSQDKIKRGSVERQQTTTEAPSKHPLFPLTLQSWTHGQCKQRLRGCMLTERVAYCNGIKFCIAQHWLLLHR